MGDTFYKWTTERGTVAVSNIAPAANVKYEICVSNGTYGRMVCKSPESIAAEAKAKADAEAAARRAYDQRMANAKAQATKECDATFQANEFKAYREQLARTDAAQQRLWDAELQTNLMRLDASNQFAKLNRIREFQDTFHDVAGVAIDIGGFIAGTALTGGWLAVAAGGTVALGALNTAARAGDGALETAVDLVADGSGEAMGDSFAHLGKQFSSKMKVGGNIIQGATFVADLVEFLSRPDMYNFHVAGGADTIQQIRDVFKGAQDPRGWMEKVWGPDMKELDKKLEGLQQNMRKEEQLAKELEEEKKKLRAADRATYGLANCIDKRFGQLMGWSR
jgi:hypothetical protein